MGDLYLISTFRHEWNRRFNPFIAEHLENRGFVGYFAHRDTNQAGSREDIFREDMAGLVTCQVVLAVAENESPNWGAEVGFAYGRGMPIVAIAREDHAIPLIADGMVTECIRVPDMDAIHAYIDRLSRSLRRHIDATASG